MRRITIYYLIAVVMFFSLMIACNLDSNYEFNQDLALEDSALDDSRCLTNPKNSNEAIINTVLKDMKNGKTSQILKYLAYDTEWVVAGQPGTTPFAGTYTGKGKVGRYLKNFYRAIRLSALVVESVTEIAPGTYEAYVRLQGYIRATHKTIDIQFLYTLKFDARRKISDVTVAYVTASLELAFTRGGEGHVVSDIAISQAAIDLTNSYIPIKEFITNLPYEVAKAILAVPPNPAPAIPDDGVLEVVDINGIYGEIVSTPGNFDDKIIVVIHGGSFIHGFAVELRFFDYTLAKLVNIPVLAIDYRLAAEDPFPAGLEDCFNVYKELLNQYEAQNIILLGASSGGNLIFSIMEMAKAENLPLPGALIGFSPWLDLTNSGESMVTNNDSDTLLSKTWLDRATGWYLTDTGISPTDPLVSPLFGDVAGFPPTYLTVSSSEVLLSDSMQMFKLLSGADRDVTIEIASNIIHCYPGYNYLPESERTLNRIADFINEKLHIE